MRDQAATRRARRRALLCLGAGLLLRPAGAAGAAERIEARSADGRWLMRADNERRELIATDASTGTEVRRIAVADRRGATSRVARLIDAAPRRSFIALLADLPETWELTYDPDAAPVYDGLVHDFRMGEGIASRGPFPVRRVVLDQPLTEALFADDHSHFVARARTGVLHVVNLHVRRRIETVTLDGDLRVADGVYWMRGGDAVFALPDRSAPRVHLLDARSWRWRAPIMLRQPARRLAIAGDGGLIAHGIDGGAEHVGP